MNAPEPEPEVLISVEKLSHAYGKGALHQQILTDIDTEIRSGEIVILTGPSGSGKTTLLTLMGALRSAQQGSLKILVGGLGTLIMNIQHAKKRE